MLNSYSNEIGGDGDIPHAGVGPARRIQVPHGAGRLQHRVMVEAVENHMPEVIVIDEIGTEAEALAARTVAQRGVQLIATAHGETHTSRALYMWFMFRLCAAAAGTDDLLKDGMSLQSNAGD